MRIGIILTIIIFIIALLGSIGGTSYYYIKSIGFVKNQIYSHLESIAQSRANNVETYLNEKKIFIENLVLIEKVEKVLLNPSSPNILAVNERFQKIIDLSDELLSISIINDLGIIITSTNQNLVGLNRSNNEAFLYGKEDTYIQGVNFTLEGTKEPIMFSSAPVIKDSKFLGVIVVRLSTKRLNEIVLDKTGIGKTGETYLINKESYAITPLLFVEDAVLEWKVDSINSRNCFTHEHEHEIGYEEHEEVQVFLDYTGKKVIGTHVYIPKIEWCLLAEISEKEISGKQRDLFQRVALTIIIFITTLVTLIGFLIGRFINKIIILKKRDKIF